ncbi:MAG: DNA-binding response regulator, partial [Staphylococcus lugdunensis]|nr:DNA-binding response regulator [Staphylococcus lugdunensis]
LREKLNRVSEDAAQMIQTVWGVGYKFEVRASDEPTK